MSYCAAATGKAGRPAMSHVPIATTPVWKAIAPSLESTRSQRGCKYHLHGALLLPSEQIMRLLLSVAGFIVIIHVG